MPHATDDPTASGAGSSRPIRALDWTIIALGLGLALLLLIGGLLPARERNRQIRQKNNALADEILRDKEDLRRRRERVRDIENDPLTNEQILRNKGALPEGEIPVPADPPKTRKK